MNRISIWTASKIFFCIFISLTTSLFSVAQQQQPGFNPYQYEIKKQAEGSKGAVVTAHPLASEVGIRILKSGGNAVDAAIAVQLALAVVYPGAGNIGGGGFMVGYLQDGKKIAVDYRESAPAAAHRDMYIDKDGNALTEKSQNGHLASGIPGTVAGLFFSHRYAKLPFRDLIAPAILLAEKGFVITKSEASSLNRHRDAFIRYNTVVPVFVKETSWKEGDTLIQKDLANTLKRIRDKGAAGFYEGETANLIVAEMKRGNGIITNADLKNYKVRERIPVEFTYNGYTILSMPLPSSGGIILQQTLTMISGKNIAEKGFLSADAVQLVTETERRAYADRAEYLGDIDKVKVPVKQLVSKSYLEKRMADYQPDKAGNSSEIKAGIPTPESEETTHLSVVDQWGNAISVTTTLNGGYGSGTVVSGAGFLMNNEMDDFSIKPGVPNMYGALGNENNAIAAGKRMLSSMTPTIVLKNNQPYLVVGTPGGTTIPTSVLQTIMNVIDFNLSVSDAVNKPKFHHQWMPDEIFVEADFPDDTVSQLKKMGYKISKRGYIGRTEVIKITKSVSNKLLLEAVGDKRGDDDARAY
ncbi:gamma-glutamyltransferase [Pollutibacter soli]|uniref:gamma-glutamyltransferase n=1 Tax=Pollutibacter soli TaxID=3034157 RepID=UPI003013CEF2